MTTSNLNIRLDDDLREQATAILADYGLTPTQAIKLFLNQIVKTQKVPLSFDFRAPSAFSPQTLAAIAEIEAGKVTRYESLEDFVGNN